MGRGAEEARAAAVTVVAFECGAAGRLAIKIELSDSFAEALAGAGADDEADRRGGCALSNAATTIVSTLAGTLG